MTKNPFLKASLFLLPILGLNVLFAADSSAKDKKEEKKKETVQEAVATPAVDIAKVSEAFGHMIGKNIESLGFNFDVANVVKACKTQRLEKNPQ